MIVSGHCSSIRGWKLGNPDGSKYEAGASGSAANLALMLLLPDLTAEQRQEALANALGQQVVPTQLL